MKTRIISYTLLLSSCLVGASLIAAPTKKDSNTMKSGVSAKIAIVDIRRMLPQDPQLLKEEGSVAHEWRDQFNKLQETLKPINEEMNKLQEDYQTKIKELEARQKSGVSSQEALQEKYRKEVSPLEYRIQAQSQQVQQFGNNELMRIQSLIGPKIQAATDEVCKSQGWDFAVTRDTVTSSISQGSRFNITDDVLAVLNDAYAKDKAKAPKPEAAKA